MESLPHLRKYQKTLYSGWRDGAMVKSCDFLIQRILCHQTDIYSQNTSDHKIIKKSLKNKKDLQKCYKKDYISLRVRLSGRESLLKTCRAQGSILSTIKINIRKEISYFILSLIC